MKNLEASVNLEGTVSITIDECCHERYESLLEVIRRYPDFTSMGVSSVSGNPPVYEEVQFTMMPKGDPKKHLECLRDLTRIIYPTGPWKPRVKV